MSADPQVTATAEPVRARASAESPQIIGPRVIDNELIDAVGTSGCGWSRKQIEILGASWPLEAGWRERIVAEGRVLLAEQVAALFAAKDARATKWAKIAAAESLPCPWCARMVKRVEQGGNVREFCSRKHKTQFNTALTTASIEHSRLLRTPGALQTWAALRVHPSQSGDEGSPRATGGAGQQDAPSAAPHDTVQ